MNKIKSGIFICVKVLSAIIGSFLLFRLIIGKPLILSINAMIYPEKIDWALTIGLNGSLILMLLIICFIPHTKTINNGR